MGVRPRCLASISGIVTYGSNTTTSSNTTSKKENTMGHHLINFRRSTNFKVVVWCGGERETKNHAAGLPEYFKIRFDQFMAAPNRCEECLEVFVQTVTEQVVG